MKLKVIIPLDEYNKLIEYADKFAEINRKCGRQGNAIKEALTYLTSEEPSNRDNHVIKLLRNV